MSASLKSRKKPKDKQKFVFYCFQKKRKTTEFCALLEKLSHVDVKLMNRKFNFIVRFFG